MYSALEKFYCDTTENVAKGMCKKWSNWWLDHSTLCHLRENWINKSLKLYWVEGMSMLELMGDKYNHVGGILHRTVSWSVGIFTVFSYYSFQSLFKIAASDKQKMRLIHLTQINWHPQINTKPYIHTRGLTNTTCFFKQLTPCLVLKSHITGL